MRRAVRLVLALAALAGLLADCARRSVRPVAPAPRPFTGPIRLALVPAAGDDAFWKQVEAGARRAAAAHRVELIWKAPGPGDSRDLQVRALESAYNERATVVAVAPADERAFARLLQVPDPRQTPLLALHTPFPIEPGERVGAVVRIQHRVAGRNAGYELARRLNGRGPVVLLRHDVGAADAREREEGFLEVVRAHPDLQLVSSGQHAGATGATAESRIRELLPRFRAATGFFAAGEAGALALCNGLRQAGLGDRVVVAYGASPALLRALEDGRLAALVVPLPDQLGSRAVEAMLALARGEPVPAGDDPALALVTLENRTSPEVRRILGEPP